MTRSADNVLNTLGPTVAHSNGQRPTTEEPFTDLGNARRLVAAHGHQLRHVPLWGRWKVWDGRRWADDDTGQVWRYAKEVARSMLRSAANAPTTAERDRLVAAAKRAESRTGLSAMIALAGTEEGIALAPSAFDADPYLLNVANGVLDLHNGRLGPHDPALHLTKLAGAAYHPDAEAPAFAAFLERIQPDPGMRAFLARLFGYGLLGRVIEHLLAIAYGHGANGKTTFFEAVMAAYGDYAGTTDPGLLIDCGESHPTGVADLFGRRLAVTHETDSGRRLAEGTVKRLTGGDRIKARRMREDFWEFDPTHLPVMVTNHRPIVRGDDDGIWRRLRLIPFHVRVPDHEQDPHLGDELTLELDGILAWLVTGYHDYTRHGLSEPEQVTEATRKYRDASDVLRRFLTEYCLSGPHDTAGSSHLFAAWSRWCAAQHLDSGTQTAFSTRLSDKGYDKQKVHGRQVWQGIGLPKRGRTVTRRAPQVAESGGGFPPPQRPDQDRGGLGKVHGIPPWRARTTNKPGNPPQPSPPNTRPSHRLSDVAGCMIRPRELAPAPWTSEYLGRSSREGSSQCRRSARRIPEFRRVSVQAFAIDCSCRRVSAILVSRRNG